MCEANGGPWDALSRYMSTEDVCAASTPVRLSVTIMDKDPGEASDDLIGAAEIRLDAMSGEVERLVLKGYQANLEFAQFFKSWHDSPQLHQD